MPIPPPKAFGRKALAAALAPCLLAVSCALLPDRGLKAEPFELPQGSRLVLGLPFYPDESSLCGPASLAAVMNYMGYPVSLEEVARGVQRWDLRGSLGPDLVLWARSQGAEARFFSAKPEDLVDLVNRQIPAVVLVDEGFGPVVKGHFMVVAGYSFEGVVVNSGPVQQELQDWSKFLTKWYKMGNFAIVVEPRAADAHGDASAPPSDSLLDSPWPRSGAANPALLSPAAAAATEGVSPLTVDGAPPSEAAAGAALPPPEPPDGGEPEALAGEWRSPPVRPGGGGS
ncbi:MAG: C39 family peptidase [Deltaproteobacteria bacterium]|jgi:hypothetical protein|nr:C39 family peptidase [Deltaproteobacteria bacterium]